MKSQRRHDLKGNELADGLDETLDFLKEHGTKILSVVLVVVLVGGVVWYMQGTRQLARSQAWQDLYTMVEKPDAVKPETLEMMAGRQNDPELNAYLFLKLGDALRKDMLSASPAERSELAARARDAYQTVINNHSDNAYAVTLAKMGMGLLYENTDQWQQAKELYLKLKNDKMAKGMGVAALAEARAENLDRWRTLARQVPQTQPATKPAETLEN